MSGKRIVFYTFGSLGDIYPFLALARELKRGGHSPVIATTPVYGRIIEDKGIEFHPVPPEVNISDPDILRRAMDRRNGGRFIVCDLVLPALRDSYQDTDAVAADADLLVTHPMTLAAFLLARKTGIAWASVALAPVSLYSIYDPPVLAGGAERAARIGAQVRTENGVAEACDQLVRLLQKSSVVAPRCLRKSRLPPVIRAQTRKKRGETTYEHNNQSTNVILPCRSYHSRLRHSGRSPTTDQRAPCQHDGECQTTETVHLQATHRDVLQGRF